MSDVVISVENLGKKYRIRHQRRERYTALRDLLASASAAGGLRVSHDLRSPVLLGAVRVTWSAWDGAPDESVLRGTRTAIVFLLPHGQAPAGLSADHNATGGNNSRKRHTPLWSACA